MGSTHSLERNTLAGATENQDLPDMARSSSAGDGVGLIETQTLNTADSVRPLINTALAAAAVTSQPASSAKVSTISYSSLTVVKKSIKLDFEKLIVRQLLLNYLEI